MMKHVTEHLDDLVMRIHADDNYSRFPWTGVVIIASLSVDEDGIFGDAGLFVQSSTGFAFTKEPLNAHRGSTRRYQAARPSRETKDGLATLAKAMADEPGARPWRHCLVQLDRLVGRPTISYSSDEELPWKSSVAGHDDWVESLRPAETAEP